MKTLHCMKSPDVLSPSFDYEFYVQDKAYLASESEALAHFKEVGFHEGLAGSPACNQGYFIRMIDRLQPASILELGPGCSPKMRGPNVFYFDVKSEDDLRSRYAGEPGYDNIPEKIHFTDDDGDLRTINQTFDVVFSSHMIEHSLDLIEHINGVEALLNPGGHYFIIAPNKNYTFDYFKPVSVVEDVVAHHFACEAEPSLSMRAVLMEKCRRTHNDAGRHWSGDHGDVPFDAKSIMDAARNFDRINRNPIARSGFHSWIFCDQSFPDLVGKLYELSLISLKLDACYNTPYGSCSFNAVMRR